MCSRHVHSTVTRASRFHCLIGVINKPTEILHGVKNSKNGSADPDHAPFREDFFIGRVGLPMISQCTKFEVSRFTRYEAMNGGAKCIK